MAPPPRSTNSGIAARVHRRKPRRFTSSVRSQMSMSMASASVSPVITGTDRSAALAWQRSTPPNSSHARRKSALTDASSAMSKPTAMAVPPAEVMRVATSLAAASFTSPTTTRAPSSPSRSDVAVPMPPAPPATTTTLSSSPRIGSASRVHPLREPDVVGHLCEDDLEVIADRDRVRIDRVQRFAGGGDDVADETDRGVVIQLDNDNVVGRLLAVGG